MKYLKNEILTGRRGVELSWDAPAIGDQSEKPENVKRPLTPRDLFYGAALNFTSEKSEDFRDVVEALNALEDQAEKDAEYLELESAWYNKLKPLAERIISVIYRANSLDVWERLAELEKEGLGDAGEDTEAESSSGSRSGPDTEGPETTPLQDRENGTGVREETEAEVEAEV